MKPNNLFNSDDRAVSPVIGVILMVAITVILAAVIGTFVLGLGDSLGSSQPTAQLNIEADTGSNITVTHRGGDPIQGDEVRVVDGSGTESNNALGDLSVGNSTTIETGFSGETTVRIIHTPSDAIIAEQTVTLA
ncbi:type IV pilin [Halorubrum sp. CBA1125]|uniref:type IV pilin n=1 Tax=Halorubrum sp. CBA1125 TaxID=2668072 RepID=UPI0012E745EA|nr:type IV pilin N-terminal domain-containing protein [Halorubrum sp. CBA1125]MUW14024.1 type IV pilin [Halorubrum sp. CBA1125]